MIKTSPLQLLQNDIDKKIIGTRFHVLGIISEFGIVEKIEGYYYHITPDTSRQRKLCKTLKPSLNKLTKEGQKMEYFDTFYEYALWVTKS